VAITGLAAGVMTRDAAARRRLSILALSILCSEAAINTQGFSADYTQIFLLFLIFREQTWTLGSSLLVGIAYLLCVTADVTLVDAYSEPIRSFFSGRTVEVDFGLTLSQFVRPLLITALQFVLTLMLCRKTAGILARKGSARRDSLSASDRFR
jgi:hypothetical protein